MTPHPKRYTWILALAASGVVLVACILWYLPAAPRPKTIPAATRAYWITRASVLLKSFQPSHRTPAATRYRDADGNICYRIRFEGIIRFPDGGWIYIITRSKRADGVMIAEGMLMPENAIGNVVIAVDHRGNLYENDARLNDDSFSVTAPRQGGFRSLEEFLATAVDQTEKPLWRTVHPQGQSVEASPR